MILTAEFAMVEVIRPIAGYKGPWVSPTKTQCEFVYLLIYHLQHLSDLISSTSNTKHINSYNRLFHPVFSFEKFFSNAA